MDPRLQAQGFLSLDGPDSPFLVIPNASISPSSATEIPLHPMTPGSRDVSIASLTRPSISSACAHPSNPAFASALPEGLGLISNTNETFNVRTLQGIQLRLGHEDTRPSTPVATYATAALSVTAQEEDLIQHYVRRLGVWVCSSFTSLLLLGFELTLTSSNSRTLPATSRSGCHTSLVVPRPSSSRLSVLLPHGT